MFLEVCLEIGPSTIGAGVGCRCCSHVVAGPFTGSSADFEMGKGCCYTFTLVCEYIIVDRVVGIKGIPKGLGLLGGTIIWFWG